MSDEWDEKYKIDIPDESKHTASMSASVGFLNNKNKECAKLEWRQGSNRMSHAAQETWGWYCNPFYAIKQKAVCLPSSREIASSWSPIYSHLGSSSVPE